MYVYLPQQCGSSTGFALLQLTQERFYVFAQPLQAGPLPSATKMQPPAHQILEARLQFHGDQK